MSRKNKVNPDHYKVAGRLSPDDLARERMKQSAPTTARAWDERPGQPRWMDGRSAGPAPTQARTPRLQGRVRRGGRLASGASQKTAPRRKRRNRPRARGRRLSPGGLPPRSRRGTRRRARTRVHLSGGGKRPARRPHGGERARRSRPDATLTQALRGELGLGVRNSRLHGFLVAGQVAVSVVLLICTATLVRNARAAAERTWALTLVDGNGAIIIPGDS